MAAHIVTPPPPPPLQDELVDRMVGTAVMLAALQLKQCIPAREALELERRASLLFDPENIPLMNLAFPEMVHLFKGYLYLNMTSRGVGGEVLQIANSLGFYPFPPMKWTLSPRSGGSTGRAFGTW